MDAKKEPKELLEEIINEKTKRDHTCHIHIDVDKDGGVRTNVGGAMRDIVAAWLVVADALYNNASGKDKHPVRRALLSGIIEAVGLRDEFEDFAAKQQEGKDEK